MSRLNSFKGARSIVQMTCKSPPMALVLAFITLASMIFLTSHTAYAGQKSSAITQCSGSQLEVKLSKTGVAMGHASVTIEITNKSKRRTRFVDGVPKVQMMSGKGIDIPTHENREASYFPYLSQPDIRVDLQPYEYGTFDIGYTDSTGFENDQCPLANEIRITPPGSSSSLTLSVRLEPFGEGTVQKHQCGEIAVSPVMTVAGYDSPPYPAILRSQPGLTESATGHNLPWGTRLTAAQSRAVTYKASGSTYSWGVWEAPTGAGQFPVRSTDGGARWTAAGPQLAADWAGGSLYYVTKVIPEGLDAVVMVSNSVIDVSTDGGRWWYQYLNAAANWAITPYAVPGGGIGLHVGPASWAVLPKQSYALYVLNVPSHQWRQTKLSPRFGAGGECE